MISHEAFNAAIEGLRESFAVALDQVRSEAADAVADMRARTRNSLIHGPVTHVDTEKQLARIQVSENDGHLSPWIPYGQFAGEFKFHNHPSVGQNMTLWAPDGELRQGVLLPFTWSTENPSPSQQNDEHVITYGALKITMKKDSYNVSIGSSSINMTGSNLTLKADRIDENP